MKSKTIAIVAAVVVIGIALAVMTVGKSSKNETNNTYGKSSTSTNTSTSKNTESANTVKITNFAFAPTTLTVKAGTKVTWTNEDSVAHTVTADNESADAPNSQLIGKGESYSFTFTKAGTYAYHCKPHPYMKATVVVTE